MYKVMMSVFLAVGLLIAVTTGVANSNENTVLPEKKPFTLALKSKVNSVNDWLNSRPDVVNNWVEETKEYQKNSWAEGKAQLIRNKNSIMYFFLGEEK